MKFDLTVTVRGDWMELWRCIEAEYFRVEDGLGINEYFWARINYHQINEDLYDIKLEMKKIIK